MPLLKPYQHKNYFMNLAIALDELGNAFIGGSPHETISAHAWRSEQDGSFIGHMGRMFIDFLFLKLFRVSDHCRSAYNVALARGLTRQGTQLA